MKWQGWQVQTGDAVRETYGVVLPGMDLSNLTGKLIVIEGTDGVGRTTQMNLLKPWLEKEGRAVLDTGLTRSALAGKGIKQAKEGHTLGPLTLDLFYATDFADRLEQEIVPALRAGFVVLTDRYIYSLMARAAVRGVDPAWIRNAYNYALKPDAVFYLKIGVDDLIPRVVFTRGFDYWESGMDLHPSEDMYESFRKYQTTLLAQFDKLAEEYEFQVIDATPDPASVFALLKEGIGRVLGQPADAIFTLPPPKATAQEVSEGAVEAASTIPVKKAAEPVKESRAAETAGKPAGAAAGDGAAKLEASDGGAARNEGSAIGDPPHWAAAVEEPMAAAPLAKVAGGETA